MKELVKKQLNDAKNQLFLNEILLIQTVNEYMETAAKLPPLKPIFGTFFQSGEIAIIAGDTGLGKSLLGVQIGNTASANHESILDQECKYKLQGEGTVLLLDFELGQRQFYNRYEGFSFSPKFLRAEFNSLYMGDETINFDIINQYIEMYNAEIIILDNISALALRSTQDVDVAIPIMRGLKQLTRKGKSVLVMAHVPKIPRNIPLTNDHLAGSKYLSNFADSVFFIGQSNENPDYRYIKQTKCRNAEIMKDVIVASIEKHDCFLGFQMVRYDSEANHLSLNGVSNDEKIEQQKKQVIDYHRQGKSLREIASLTGISKSRVQRIIKSVPELGQNGTFGTNGIANGTPLSIDFNGSSEELLLSQEEKGQSGTINGTNIKIDVESSVPNKLSQGLSQS